MYLMTKSRSRSLPNHYRASSNRIRNAPMSMYAAPQIAPRPHIQPIITDSYYSQSQSSLNSAFYQHSINPSIYQNQSYASSFPNYRFYSNRNCNTPVCCSNYTNNNCNKTSTPCKYDPYSLEKCGKYCYNHRYENTLEYLKFGDNLNCQKNDLQEINNNAESVPINKSINVIDDAINKETHPVIVKFDPFTDVIKEENYGDI